MTKSALDRDKTQLKARLSSPTTKFQHRGFILHFLEFSFLCSHFLPLNPPQCTMRKMIFLLPSPLHSPCFHSLLKQIIQRPTNLGSLQLRSDLRGWKKRTNSSLCLAHILKVTSDQNHCKEPQQTRDGTLPPCAAGRLGITLTLPKVRWMKPRLGTQF